jgi:uncharacterized membrane protein YhaH (DUF805 family)
MQWMILAYRRYFDFSGRSRRKEYWFFALFTTLVIMVLAAVMVGLLAASFQGLLQGSVNPIEAFGGAAWGGLALIGVFILASIIPGVALQVRRLHDLGVSGWWYLAYVVIGPALTLVPNVGDSFRGLISLGWIVWMFFPGTKGPNQYGDDPKDPLSADIFA